MTKYSNYIQVTPCIYFQKEKLCVLLDTDTDCLILEFGESAKPIAVHNFNLGLFHYVISEYEQALAKEDAKGYDILVDMLVGVFKHIISIDSSKIESIVNSYDGDSERLRNGVLNLLVNLELNDTDCISYVYDKLNLLLELEKEHKVFKRKVDEHSRGRFCEEWV